MTTRAFTLPSGSGVKVTLGTHDGELVVTSVTIARPEGVVWSDLRLNLGRLIAEAKFPATNRRRARLSRPDGRDPEKFYAAVAEAYKEYVTQTEKVAVKIAEEASVPVTTVHRWILEARRRGFLPAATKGRAG
jgi:hypothetical protein